METDTQGALAKGKMVLACGGGAWGTAESAVRRPLDRGLCGYDSEGVGGKVVRFHVLANSDSEADQTLKLAVRDRVLQEYGDLLETCTSKEETLAALKNAQQEISETAEAEVLAQGYTYPVRVSLVREEFPFKKYGDLIFPAGVYDALRIEIGEAKGEELVVRAVSADVLCGCGVGLFHRGKPCAASEYADKGGISRGFCHGAEEGYAENQMQTCGIVERTIK